MADSSDISPNLFGSLLLCLLCPGIVEYLLHNSESVGNMGMYGVYLDIYRKRNLVYFSPTFVGVGYYFDHMYIGISSVLLCIGLFVYTCNEWRVIIAIDITKH